MVRVSIVIPTSNRPEHVVFAVRSALAIRSAALFEVVCSNNGCDSETERALRPFATDSRLRVVSPSRLLPMPDHWTFALDQARGDYVALLCDDDVVSDGFLELVFPLIETGEPLIVYQSAAYWANDWPETELSGRLMVPSWSVELKYVRTREVLERLFSFDYLLGWTPRLLNCVVSKELLDGIRALYSGKRFVGCCPDFSFAVGALSLIDRFVYVPVPLAVTGANLRSIGGSGRYGVKNRAQYVSEFEQNPFDEMPYQHSTPINGIAQTLMACGRHATNELSGLSVRDVDYATAIVSYAVMAGEDKEIVSDAWRIIGELDPPSRLEAVRRVTASVLSGREGGRVSCGKRLRRWTILAQLWSMVRASLFGATSQVWISDVPTRSILGAADVVSGIVWPRRRWLVGVRQATARILRTESGNSRVV